MPEITRAIGRLALRVEGDNWVAYYAQEHTMKDALLLGSIKMALVVDHPTRKAAFMEIMKDAVGDMIRAATGEKPGWNAPQRAPENERSGRA